MTRFNVSVILAACIVAVSLIASAMILTHRPTAAATSSLTAPALAAKPTGTPPIAQASVEEQFRMQVLAAPTLHSYRYNGRVYMVTDVKVNQAIYTAKEDTFDVLCDWVWQPAMPPSGPQGSYCDLSNDGYGHYYGSVSLDPYPGSAGQRADITIK